MITYRYISSLPSDKEKRMFIEFHYTRTGTIMCNCYPSDRSSLIQTKSKSTMSERSYIALIKAFPESHSLCNSEYEIYSWLEKKGYFVIAVINS